MKNNFKVGDKVRYPHDRNYHGVVKEVILEGVEYRVQWGNSNELTINSDNELQLIDEKADRELAQQAQLLIHDAASALERAFDFWKEAVELYGDSAATLRSDPLIDVSGFQDICEKFGWQTSSLYC